MASKPAEYSVAAATFAPFRLIWRLALSLLMLWFVSVVVTVAWVRMQGLDPDTELQKDIGYYVDRSVRAGLVEEVAMSAYWAVFEATAMQRRLVARLDRDSTRDSTTVGNALRRGVGAAFRSEIRGAAWATVLFSVKLTVAVLAAPLLLILLAAAAIDGLVQRYIRRACGGHESAAIYHRAKLYGVKLLPAFAATIFLCSPVTFDPGWVLMPTGLVCACLLRLQATYYKKYL